MADESTNFGDFLKAAATLAIVVAGAQVLNNLLAGKTKTQQGTFPLNQPVMPVTNFVGDYSLTAGGFVFREVSTNAFVTIQAISDGRLDSIDAIYYGGDKVTLDGSGNVITVSNGGTAITDGRYIDNKINIQTRLGLATETAYPDVTSRFSSIWDSACRGDNTGSISVQRFAPEPKFMAQAHPAGPVDAQVATRGVCYDWRQDSTAGGTGAQRRNDDTTWGPSANAMVNLVHKEWYTWGRDWDTQIAPVLDALTAQADICDEAFALKAGGTQPKYRVAFNYPDDEDIATTRQRILDAMDGFYAEDGFGRLIAKAGKYEEPDVTFTGDDIIASNWVKGTLSPDAVDLINVNFINPADDYKQAQCDPWIINIAGNRATTLDLEGVYSLPQARFLAKRKAQQLAPAYRGSIKVGRRGRFGLAKRYIRVQNPRRPSMADVVCEVRGVSFDPSNQTFTYTLISADPNIDTWNASTEEGDAVGTTTGVGAEALAAPVIVSATAVYNDVSSARISIVATGPSRSDIVWSGRWRVHGSTAWVEFTDSTATGGSVTLTTGTVPVDSSIDYGVEYTTASGTPSGFVDDTAGLSTSTSAIAPGPVTDLAATGSAGQADLTWRNPTSSNFDHAIILRSTSSSMTSPTTVATIYGSAGALESYSDTGLAAGTYYYTVTAYNASGTASTTPSPVSATVT